MKTIIICIFILLGSIGLAWGEDDFKFVKSSDILIGWGGDAWKGQEPVYPVSGEKYMDYDKGQEDRIVALGKELEKLKEKLNWLLETIIWQTDGRKSPLSEIYEYREKDDKFYPKLDVVPNN